MPGTSNNMRNLFIVPALYLEFGRSVRISPEDTV